MILGAGYGGLRTALKLERLLKNNPDWQILLIDQYEQHQLKTEFHEAAAGKTGFEAVSIPIAETLEGKRINFLCAEATAIDFNQQVVITTKGKVRYDKLVIALGSQTEFFGIPGLREHALTLDSLDDAKRIKTQIKEMFIQAQKQTDKIKKQAILTFVIGGGGFTGVELATELVDYIAKLSKSFGIPENEPQLIIVEAGETILPGFDIKLIRRATQIVKSKGIRLMLKSPCVSVDANAVHFKTGKSIQTCTVIWTGGVKANDLVAEAGLKYGPRSRVIVSPYLESVDHPSVYVIGDNSLVLDPLTNRPLAPTAQLALQQADFAAFNIYAEVKGIRRVRYVPKVAGQFVPLGGRNSVGWIWKFRVAGFLAWFLKRMTVVRYLYSLGGVKLLAQKIVSLFFSSGDC